MKKIQEIMKCQANFVFLVQLKLFKENVLIITHSYDFEKLLQGAIIDCKHLLDLILTNMVSVCVFMIRRIVF